MLSWPFHGIESTFQAENKRELNLGRGINPTAPVCMQLG